MSKKAINHETEQKVSDHAETSVEEVKKAKSNSGFLLLIFLFFMGLGGYYVVQNPQILAVLQKESQSPVNEALTAQLTQLQNQQAALQAQLLNLPKPDLSVFESKVEALEKQNLNVIDSKADASIVLGMLTRVDKLENRLDKLAKISDDGALILSAAMLVKDAAASGSEFVYEAEILNQLTPNTAPIKKDVSVISEYAHNGIVSKNVLIRQFEDIYNAATVDDSDAHKNWKERLNDKLSEYIKINKVGENKKENLQKKEFDTIAFLVSEGEIKKALALMESSENDDIRQNQALQEWSVDAHHWLSFNQAIRHIAAFSLAEMKINNLKNKE